MMNDANDIITPSLKSIHKNNDGNLLCVAPVRDLVIFPGVSTTLLVGRIKSINAIEKVISSDSKEILLVLQKDPYIQRSPCKDDLREVGTKCCIRKIVKDENGIYKILAEGLCRVSNLDFFEKSGCIYACYKEQKDIPSSNDEVYKKIALDRFNILCEVSSDYDKSIIQTLKPAIPSRALDVLAHCLQIDLETKFNILKLYKIEERANFLLENIEKEIEKEQLEEKIRSRISEQMSKSHKDYYLSEKLKAITKELGYDNSDFLSLAEKIKNSCMHDAAKDKLLKENKRLHCLPAASAESGVIRQYIETVLDLPWGKYNTTDVSISYVKSTLEKSHFGQLKVKERILEYIATFKRTESTKGPILCLLGPPGVGKTSIAIAFAQALKRPYVRVSLGGIRDDSEIRGTRRTYVGSMPGTIINKIISAGTSSPLMVLDEIDKISNGDFRGDPSSCLLEVLDPALNSSFRDHYLDLEFDLSKVLFVATANSMNIHPALADRLEIIELDGYTDTEKILIAKSHLIPKVLSEHNVQKDKFKLSSSVIKHIVNKYTYESGVRSLRRCVEKLIRQLILKNKLDSDMKQELKVKDIVDYLGEPRVINPLFKIAKDSIGIINGLSYSMSGQGDVLQIECTIIKGSGKLVVTGNLGSIMDESVKTAFTAVKKVLFDRNIQPVVDLEKVDIHVHFPEAAVSKDGPSAGLGIAVAIFSAVSQKTIRKDVAITGETTINGYALPIGGLREKILAALRHNITNVIVPQANNVDINKIRKEDIKGVNIIYVNTVLEVLNNTLTNGL